MQIKRITIENFQSHVKTVIEPAPVGQLTALTGQSDTGKTAVIRALRWVFYNTWDASYMRHGAKFARVTVEYEDGTKVIRERSRSGSANFYEIIWPDGNKTHLARFGGTVPLEVREITGVSPMTVADMDININLAEQGEPWFLGRPVSAPARAKVLGKLAGTEEVDMAARGVATDILRGRQEEKKLVTELAGLDEQIRKFDYLPEMAEHIEEIEKVLVRARETQGRRDKLVQLRRMLLALDTSIEAARTVIQRWQYIELAEHVVSDMEKVKERNSTLQKLAQRLRDAEDGIGQSSAVIKKYVGLQGAEEEIKKASAQADRRERLLKLKIALCSADQGIRAATATMNRWTGVELAGEYADRGQKIGERRAVVARLGSLLKQIDAAIQKNEIARCRWAQAGESEELLFKAVVVREKRTVISGLALKLRNLDNDARKARDAAFYWEQRVGDLEGAYRDELTALGRCPVCGGDIDIQRLKEVV
ncbi:AAA family ATPase [Pelotomaculum propionicicum]|uniref:Nuclease SbcCD subunit C n=1 Tax=Pelotomaculum propionicicum TaxID=258475 RepID=A0A4Y7RWM8_9FIRM|nr:AAA family ATPase [Pelotomaculum propionicicum]TEB13405.1 hypothetical protein Pmgp_00299 [Pelotomaculum propionicicum]